MRAAAAAAASFQVSTSLPDRSSAGCPRRGEEGRGSLDCPGRGPGIGAWEGEQGAIQDLQEGAEAFPQEAAISLWARQRGGSVPPFFTGPRSPHASPCPPSEEEVSACICPRGRSGRRSAWPRTRSRLSPQATRRSLSPAWLPFPLPSVGPGPTPRPSLLGRPLLSFPPPALCSWLWGWARDVKPSVASARLAGAAIKRATSPSHHSTVSSGTGADRLGIKC